MAQIVGYWDNHVIYTEGPFVAVNANGWRIEVAQNPIDQPSTPIIPHLSIYRLLETEKGNKPGKLSNFSEIAPYVDWLNLQVEHGRIVFDDCWICAEYRKSNR